MSVKFSPFGNSQILDAAGNPAVGWTIGTYTAGSSTRLASYTDSTGATPQTADIVLNALGLPTNGQIWLTAGSSYKFIVKNASGVTQFTVDGISGVNDVGAATVSQWQSSNLTPTFVSTTSFTVPGDQTTELHVKRKLQFTTGAGTAYGEIATTAFGALTTVTMTMSGSDVLDSGLSVVNLAILRADHPATPGSMSATTMTGALNEAHGADIASAATINLTTATGNLVDVTGTTTITAITLAEGAERTVRFTGILTLTNGASLVLPGAANITTAAGDFAIFRAYAAGVVRCVDYSRANGSPIIVPLARLSAAAANSGYPQSGTGGETLRTIRGNITSGAVILEGTGFSVVRNSSGDYTVTFTTPFSAPPAVSLTLMNFLGFIGVDAGDVTASTMEVFSFNSSSVRADANFSFIAVGPA